MTYILIVAGVFLLDYIIKSHIDKNYECKVKHSHLGGKFILEKYYNYGAALNLLEKRPKLMRSLNTIVFVIAGVLYYFTLRSPNRPIAKTGLSLLLGGGMSNLFDRYTKGHVVDYFHINIGPKWFKRIIFNISDFCIFIGSLLTAISAAEK